VYKVTTEKYLTEQEIDRIKAILNVEKRRDEENLALGKQFRIQLNTEFARFSEYATYLEEAQMLMAEFLFQIICQNVSFVERRNIEEEYVQNLYEEIKSTESIKFIDGIFVSKTRCFAEGNNAFEIVIIDLLPKSGKPPEEGAYYYG
jgi:hypothetical protein